MMRTAVAFACLLAACGLVVCNAVPRHHQRMMVGDNAKFVNKPQERRARSIGFPYPYGRYYNPIEPAPFNPYDDHVPDSQIDPYTPTFWPVVSSPRRVDAYPDVVPDTFPSLLSRKYPGSFAPTFDAGSGRRLDSPSPPPSPPPPPPPPAERRNVDIRITGTAADVGDYWTYYHHQQQQQQQRVPSQRERGLDGPTAILLLALSPPKRTAGERRTPVAAAAAATTTTTTTTTTTEEPPTAVRYAGFKDVVEGLGIVALISDDDPQQQQQQQQQQTAAFVENDTDAAEPVADPSVYIVDTDEWRLTRFPSDDALPERETTTAAVEPEREPIDAAVDSELETTPAADEPEREPIDDAVDSELETTPAADEPERERTAEPSGTQSPTKGAYFDGIPLATSSLDLYPNNIELSNDSSYSYEMPSNTLQDLFGL